MTPNFFPPFAARDLVEILDETGFSTGRRAQIVGKCVDPENQPTGFYNVTLLAPNQGCHNIPAGRLKAVIETRPVQPRRTPRRKAT